MIRNSIRTTIAFGLLWSLLLLGPWLPMTRGFVPAASAQVLTESPEPTRASSVYFEENVGQFNKRAAFLARGTSGYDLFLTPTDAVYVVSSDVPDAKSKAARLKNPKYREPGKRSATAVYMSLAGANSSTTLAGADVLEHKTNYFKGPESDWHTGVSNFGIVRAGGVYDGVDLIWHGGQTGRTQYDFVVAPNADPNRIEWRIKGAGKVELSAAGELVISTKDGVIRQSKPSTYQEKNGFRAEVESGFVLDEITTAGAPKEFSVKFALGDYDRSAPLVIDPSVNLANLAYSTFLGGSENDVASSTAVDKVGNVYVTGYSESASFPVTAGSVDTSANGSLDVYVAKLNAAGAGLIYSTFLGGSGQDWGLGLAIDDLGNAYITGLTSSSTFPTAGGAATFDSTYNGNQDAFYSKLNPTGSTLLYSTFLGGTTSDTGYAIAVDASQNVYVAGSTTSPSFPVLNAFDSTHNGFEDGFAAKFSQSGSLIYSTFLGGAGTDRGQAIAVDSSGSAYLTGFTDSANYPTTAGTFDTTQNGFWDAFVTKLNASGTALVYSTFLGGSSDDVANAIAVDGTGRAVIAGYTSSATTRLPTTSGVVSTTLLGSTDGFATQFSPAGNSLVYSTFLGGTATDEVLGIVLDDVGKAYLTGDTFSGDYPTTFGAFNRVNQGIADAYLTVLNANATSYVYSTYIGGTGFDFAFATAIDDSGNVYIAGQSGNAGTNLPTTSEAFQPFPNGNNDAFVAKFGDFSISGRALDTNGAALGNVAIGLSGDGDGFQLTDGQGNFGFGNTLVGGTYLVSALNTLYNFNPPNYTIASMNRNKRLTFVGRPTSSGPTAALADLGGEVTSTVGNAGLPNATLTLVDTARGEVRTTTTDAQGNYKFANIRTGDFYVVFAEREGYNFTPGTTAMAFLAENLAIDFTAAPNSPRPVRDFDGDGKSDLAVFRPAEGNWYILQSQNNALKVVRFGAAGDIPLAEDFDGDRRADLAVYRPSDGNWYRLNSSDGAFSAVRFGLSEDIPVPADFDGDGKSDIAVFRPSTGDWHRLNSSDGAYGVVHWGQTNDRPVPADFDSDGKADPAVYRNGTWYRLNSSTGQASVTAFGLAEDKPMAADFDGDGRSDIAVFRPSTGVWYWLDNADGEFHAVRFGLSGDLPVPADYNGDGRLEQAVYRGGTWFIGRADGTYGVGRFGVSTDLPIESIR